MSQLTINIYEDGGNPRLASDIIRTANGFLIRPVRTCSNMNVELVNPTNAPIETKIEIESGTLHESGLRDYLLLHSADDKITFIDAPSIGTRQHAKFAVPPGAHCLCVNHRYEMARLERLLDSLDKGRFTVKAIGKTRMGRDMIGIEAGNPDKRPITFVMRIHPYETPGSFFAEGMLNWLNDTAEGAAFLKEHRLGIVPIANPDGVAIGNSYLTYGGLNLSADVRVTSEPEAVAIREFFLSLNPYLTIDFHGWMHRYDDNITTSSLSRGKAVYEALIGHTHALELQYSDYPLSGGKNNIGGIMIDCCGADFFNCSWTPRGRTVEQMHAIGVAFLKALAE